MISYFGVVIFIWILIIFCSYYFNIQLVAKSHLGKYVMALFLLFVVPGFLVDIIAVKFEWYIFPPSSQYLWKTPFGIPVEEIFFFITVPVWILVLWKISKKIF